MIIPEILTSNSPQNMPTQHNKVLTSYGTGNTLAEIAQP